jgi:histidine ammonia-lyase
MGANAATKCYRVINNVEKVLAIELLSAIQAIEYRRPMKSSNVIEKIIFAFREKVCFNEADRFLRDDIINAVEFIRSYELE